MQNTQRTRVKICGITCVEDALAAANAGADAIGLVFYSSSPRAVTPAQAAAICQALPPFVTATGLFVDEEPEIVRAILKQVPLDLLQFHGNETPTYCAAFGRPWIKALRMAPETDLHALAQRYVDARGLLLDAYVPGKPGGTGEIFDWRRVPDTLPLPVILAGGLAPDNVGEAIRQTLPWGVDVSGGVEQTGPDGKKQPGRKSAEAIIAFMQGVTGVSTT